LKSDFEIRPRLKEPIQDDVAYTTQALRQDLAGVRNAWNDCQANRDRDAIHSYLAAVFDLVTWWAAEDRAISRARSALRLQGMDLPTTDEPFAERTCARAASSAAKAAVARLIGADGAEEINLA
jgi:hypothetical protein